MEEKTKQQELAKNIEDFRLFQLFRQFLLLRLLFRVAISAFIAHSFEL